MQRYKASDYYKALFNSVSIEDRAKRFIQTQGI